MSKSKPAASKITDAANQLHPTDVDRLDLYTVGEAAEIAKLSPMRFRQLVQQGRVAAKTTATGRQWLIAGAALAKFVTEHKENPRAKAFAARKRAASSAAKGSKGKAKARKAKAKA